MRRAFVSMVAAIGLSFAGGASAAEPGAAPDDSVIVANIDDATYDAGFQCPEGLGDPDAREEDLARFMAWAKLRHPDWNFRKRLDVRYGLLRRHACAVTLANITASAQPAFAP
ncbi:MAG TPA: hypothetical protein VMU08_07910 [Rhizomicrobium sp.]|nr:hypothetical protein [Rhizomicrobium sp.]